MRKILIPIIVMVMILTSCNLPATKTTPSADIIATRVAGTLAASQSGATSTPESVLPTLSLETATPEPTATATITPTATTPPNDPKLTLGSPDYTFNSATSGNPFGLVGSPYEDDSVVISHQVGGINFASKTINGGNRWRLAPPSPTNFYVEGTFKVNSCSGHDNYGLAMRMPTYTSTLGYFVGLTCDGNYIVHRIDAAGNGSVLISWTPDTNIKTGEGQTNRLGVMLVNDAFKIYINGVLVKEFTDDTITTKGHVGAYTSALGNSNFNVDLQELLEWDQ